MDFRLLMELRHHLSIKHHVPGRIRIKFSLKLLGDPRAKALKEEAESSPAPSFIKSTRVNPMGRSVIIEYDPEVIDPGKLNEAFTTANPKRFEELAAELEDIMTR